MPDRTINFGESETEATYQIQDTDGAAGGGNFVVAKDTNANTVLLEYQPGSDTWQYAGDVDMNGGNVSGVGTLTADSVNTQEITNGPIYAGNKDGADPKARLENAISDSASGGVIFLENTNYDQDITISEGDLRFVGTAMREGPRFRGDVIIDGDSNHFSNVRPNQSLTINGQQNIWEYSYNAIGSGISITGRRNHIHSVYGGSIELTGTSEQNVVNGCRVVSITDNGTNNSTSNNT